VIIPPKHENAPPSPDPISAGAPDHPANCSPLVSALVDTLRRGGKRDFLMNRRHDGFLVG
jgi:hypothetical protein